MKKKSSSRVLSLLLTLAMLTGGVAPISAAGNSSSSEKLKTEKVDADIASRLAFEDVSPADSEVQYADGDIVRVSVVLEKKSTLEKFATADALSSNSAVAYREQLDNEQESIIRAIEDKTDAPLDVVWNLTLAANIISANVKYKEIETIKEIDGVKSVFVEKRYDPMVLDSDSTADPNMSTSSEQIGSSAAWASGYTGAGSRIAVIDTGIDTDHQSFSEEGYEYSLAHNAEMKNIDADEYKESLDLLDNDEIEDVFDQLNISRKNKGRVYAKDIDKLRVSSKIPFAYNYIDQNFVVDHDHDGEGEHGSHVEGIAAANSYIPNGDGTYSHAIDTVKVQGVAPDAQIITMKVFGANGGAYESDYMAAIEDAIVLGCDSINLSLGTVNSGFTRPDAYSDIMDSLAQSGTVVTISAGNSYAWADYSKTGSGLLYSDDVSFQTGGAPGTYSNPLTVASVENDGYTGHYFTVGGENVFYTEVEYNNNPLTELEGEQEYVFMTNYGGYTDYFDVDVEGKIVFVSRGGDNTFAQKASTATRNGAVATIIYNNEPGTFTMDLSSYWGSAPCVSISQADAEMIKNSSTKSEEGDWYTGTLTVATGIDSVKYGSEYYTMSDFSSWGVPGSLELKPEITAPGGNIYSVNGAVEGGKSYESMSGTSMAAPQAAGMAALLGQYIRENDLTTKTNKTERQLINSLLMSTAEPLTDEASGSYYSVLEQGAGLANIGNAINADSYIMMEENLSGTASDGKVKAELGDDPDRNGTYTVKFSVNNLFDEEKNYTFSTDIFTQAIVEKGGYSYLDKKTTPIAADIKYKVNGEEFVPTTKIECDVDHDGDTDSDDAQMILNYATGLIYQIDRIADIDGDNNITSYDAYLLLSRLTIASADVEANGSVEVEVEIKLNDAAKAYLDEKYANGAYIEGYIGVETANTEDGEILPMHSIPVLGFYGNWSDASMLDTTTYEERVYGDATPSYLGEAETNKLVVRYPGEKTNSVYTANPYMVEPEYHPADRLALNSKTSVYRYDYSIIRNASAVAYFVQNENGEVIYLDIAEEQLTSAFYHANALKWYDTADSITVNQKPSSLGLSEGDKFTAGLVLIPEYYETNGSLDKAQIKSLIESGKLGHGAYFAAEYTVDDTAPVLKDVEKNLLTGDITVTAQDNEYIADVKVYKGSGSTLLGEVLPEQSEAGEECSAVFDLDSSAGEYIMIFLADYAGNEVYYKVSYGGDAENYTGKMYGFTSSNARDSKGKRWVEIDPETLNYDYSSASKNTGFANAAVVDYEVYAAEYVGKYVFFATEDGVYTAPQGEWSNTQKVTDFSALASKEIILDMAYNIQNDTLYAVTGVCSNLDSGSLDNTVSSVYSIDVVTGEMTKVLDIDVYDPRNEFSPAYKLIRTLAIDNNGTFYATNNANGRDLYLYKWTLDDMAGGVINTLHPVDDDNYGYLYGSGMYGQYYTSMTYDHDKNVMYFASGYGDKSSNDSDNILWVIDTAAGKAAKASSTYNSQLRAHVVGLYAVSASSAPLPSDTPVSKVTVSPANVSILKDAKTELTASVYPWLAPDKSVTWTSSNESIAKVENGVVYGIDIGQAVITVSSVSDSTKTAQCSVTVEKLPDIKLDALLTDNEGNSHWAEFDVNSPASYTYLSDSDYYFAGTMNNEEIIVHDGAHVYGIDPDTYEKTLYGSLAETWAWSDTAEGPKSEEGFFGQIVGICNGGKYIEFLDAPSAKLGYFDLSETFDSDPMAVIAYSGSGRYDYVYSKWLTYDNCPANFYYVITEEGALYKLNVFIYDNDNKPGVTAEKIGYTDVELPGVSGLNGEKTASMFYESESGYLIVSSRIFDKEVSLYAVSVNDIVSAKIGTFGSDIASAVSLFRYDRPTDLTLKLNPTEVTLYKGDSTKIKAKVILGSTNELTWKSSDNSVATVENGVITGVSEGNATITATTVDVNKDGQHVSASVNVNIKSLIDVNATVSAQITDENGTSWVDINLGSDMAVTVKKSGATKLNGGGLSDGYIYGSDALLEEEGEGNIYRINADSFTEEVGADVSAYAILDLDDAPALEFTYTDYYDQPTRYDAFGMPLYITYSSDMAMLTDYTGNQNLLVWKFSESYPDLAAIAYIGDIEETGFGSGYDPGTIAHMYMLLGADGTLYKVKVTPMYDTSAYKVSYKTTRTEFGTLGISFTDRTALSMTYIELSADEYGLLIADAATGSIYYASMANTSGENVYLGKVGKIDGALDITSLYNARLNSAAGNSNAGTEARVSIREAEFNAVSMSDDIAAEYAVNESKAVNKSNGSLNAAAPESVKDSDADADEHVLTVDVIEDVAVTNGKYTVTYDPAKVTFKSAVSSQKIKAFNVDETKGVVTFAFASDEAVAAGTTLATVTFEYGDYVNTEVTITVDERNDDTDVDEEPVVITIEDEVGDHDWEEIERVEPTCTENGYIVYKCTRCEETKTEVLKALGHNFVVEEGYAGLTRNKLVCSRCGLVISGNSPIPVINPKTSPILNPTKPTTPVVEPKEDDEDEEPVVEEPADVSAVDPVKSELPFTDVTPEDWFYTAVEYLYNEGIMNGTSETEFSPEYELNRATVVTILYRLEGEPEVETAGTFSDVEEGEWYTAAVEWAASVGIVKGYEDGTFAPKKAVTREQLAAIIYRYAEFKGITIAETTAELGEEAVVSDWAKANVEWAVSEGLLVEGENVNATENANRAEVAAMIYTFLTKTSK